MQVQTYVAVMKVSLGLHGDLNSNQIILQKGTTVEYDGRKATIDGVEYTLPNLRSAIKAKWLVTAAELYGEDYVPPTTASADISMRGATPEQDTVKAQMAVSEEERDMGTIQGIRANNHSQVPVVEAQDGRVVGSGFGVKAFRKGAAGEATAVDVSSMTSTSTVALEETSARQKLAEFEKSEARRAQKAIAEMRAEQGISSRRAPTREGVQFRPGPGVVQHDVTDLAPEMELWDGEGSQGHEVVGTIGRPVAVKVSAEDVIEDKEARLALARQMLPTFEWDFDMNWRSKLKLLKDEASPVFIFAAYAVETAKMKAQISKTFPQYNLG